MVYILLDLAGVGGLCDLEGWSGWIYPFLLYSPILHLLIVSIHVSVLRTTVPIYSVHFIELVKIRTLEKIYHIHFTSTVSFAEFNGRCTLSRLLLLC